MDQSQRYIKHVLTSESMTWVSNQIASKIDRPLDTYENTDLVSYARKQKRKNWKHAETGDPMTVRQIREAIVYQFWLDRMGGFDTLSEKEQSKVRGVAFKYDTSESDVKEILKGYVGNQADGYDVDLEALDNVDENGYPTTTPVNSSSLDNVDIFEESTMGNIGTIQTIERLLRVDAIDIVNVVGNVEKLFGVNDKFQLQALLNPHAQKRSSYITLDSKYRLTSSDGADSIQWNFLNNSAINAQGAVNSIGVVQNIVGIKIQRFRIPYLDSADNVHKKITMLIQEFSAQSHIAQENRRFHFQFSPEIDGNQINLLPWPSGTHHGEFKFRTPITQIDTLSLSFGAPLTAVTFDNDRLQASVTHTANGLFTTPTPHNLLTGDVVSFTNFTSLSPNSDEPVINLVNVDTGNSIVVVDQFNFEINVDLTAITVPLFPQTVVAYFESKRIFIDMELIYAESAPEI
jgi:hypothetical protein